MNKIIDRILLVIIKYINLVYPKKSNNIIFYSSPDYTDNPRAIYEELLKYDKNNFFNITWVVKDINKFSGLNFPCKFVRHRSLGGLFAFMSSKYIVRSHSFWGNNYVKGKQIMVLAWHGMPLKSIGSYENGCVMERNNYDFLHVTSALFKDIMSKCMNSDKSKNIISGLPRNDNLFRGRDILRLLRIDHYDKIIIWMPTFRESKSGYSEGKITQSGLPCIDINDLHTVDDLLKGQNVLLLLKLHHWSTGKINCEDFTNIKKVTDEDIPVTHTLYNLLGESDALITDYFSVYIDYLLLDKPIGFMYDDLEEYRKARGFIFEPITDYMPGMKMSNLDQLIIFINNICAGIDNYKNDRNKVNLMFNKFMDDQSSFRFIKEVGLLELLESKNG